jgi:hypothetical protein
MSGIQTNFRAQDMLGAPKAAAPAVAKKVAPKPAVAPKVEKPVKVEEPVAVVEETVEVVEEAKDSE